MEISVAIIPFIQEKSTIVKDALEVHDIHVTEYPSVRELLGPLVNRSVDLIVVVIRKLRHARLILEVREVCGLPLFTILHGSIAREKGTILDLGADAVIDLADSGDAIAFRIDSAYRLIKRHRRIGSRPHGVAVEDPVFPIRERGCRDCQGADHRRVPLLRQSRMDRDGMRTRVSVFPKSTDGQPFRVKLAAAGEG